MTKTTRHAAKVEEPIDRRMTASWRLTGEQAEKHRASINWSLLHRMRAGLAVRDAAHG